MVEQVTISPEEVRGYGNICEGHTLEDFIVSNSGLAKEKEDVDGALTEVYKLVYSVYGLMFDFDKGNKQLYLQVAEADTLSFGFDEEGKQLYLVDENKHNQFLYNNIQICKEYWDEYYNIYLHMNNLENKDTNLKIFIR